MGVWDSVQTYSKHKSGYRGLACVAGCSRGALLPIVISRSDDMLDILFVVVPVIKIKNELYVLKYLEIQYLIVDLYIYFLDKLIYLNLN